jgi:galactofuranose transport system permease protein
MREARRLIWPIAALAALLMVNAIFSRSFFHLSITNGHIHGSMIDVLDRGAPVMLLALGMSLVIATGGIDLSVGAVMAIAGAVAASLIARPIDSPVAIINAHGSIAVIIMISLAAALLAGLWNGALVVLLGLQPIVATLILMVAGRGIAQLLTDGQIVTFDNARFAALGRAVLFGLPFPVTIVAAAAILISLVARWTALGLFIESVGNNPTASRLAGIPAVRVKLLVYTIGGLCAGLAGLIITADLQAADANNSGLNLELDAILAVSLGGASLAGGRFSLVGALIGAILLQTLTTTIFSDNVPPPLTLVVKGALVVAVCVLQSPRFRGMFLRGRKGAA